MDAKETILNVIKSNGWVTGVRRFDLLVDLQQHYGMNADIADSTLQECLSEGLVTIERDKFKMTTRGQKYLQNISRDNYIETAHRVANTSTNTNTVVRKKRWGLEQWSWVAGIIATALAVYEFFIKK